MPRNTPNDSFASADDQAVTLADIASPRELAAERPEVLTEEGLRWLIRHRRRNGLTKAGAVLLIRNRVVLVRSRFERWLAQQIV